MDPLSIVAGIIAIGTVTISSLKIILKLRGASDEVQALINELSDLSAIVKDVENTLRFNKPKDPRSAAVASFGAVLTKGNTVVNHLHSFVHRVLMKEEKNLGNERLSRMAWLREKPQVAKYKRELSAVRTELLHALSIANLASGARIELGVANVVTLTTHSKALLQSQTAQTRELRHDMHQLLQIFDSKQLADSDCTSLSSSTTQPGTLSLRSEKLDDDTSPSIDGHRGLEIQVIWRPPWACKASCCCICHQVNRGRSPRQLDRLLGILFWGYAGLPVFRKSCNMGECRRQRGIKFGMSYYFPAWFVAKKIELMVLSMPLGPPQLCIKMANIVPNGALLFKYGNTGDLPGLQSLFSQGLATPSDIGHLDGASVLTFAVTRGHIEMIDFLLKNGADPHVLDSSNESPASIAWQLILSNSQDQRTTDYLRAAFSERDFLDEQSFNPIHDIVLGLNGRKLAQGIKHWPHLMDCPDVRGNTPLIWAARRGDVESLRTLLDHGASTDFRNNNGRNAWYCAVIEGRLDCATMLLDSGEINHKDRHGLTVLHRASMLAGDSFIRLALKHKPDIDEQDVFHRCALGLAAWYNNSEGVAYLIKRGANKETRDIFGATPLLRALQYKATDAATVFLENGCDVLVTDHEGQTVLHRTVLSRHVPTMHMLASKADVLRHVDINAKDNLGKTAKDHLDTVDPDADLLKAYAEITTAISAAKVAAQKTDKLLTHTNLQEVFEDAREYLSDGSPIPSYSNSDSEELRPRTRHNRRVKLITPFRNVGKKWSFKYKNTFRSFERASDSASSSTSRLIIL